MITGFPQSIVIFVLVVIFYCMDTLYIQRFDRVRQGEGSGRSVSYTLMVIGMVAVLVLQPLLVPQISLVVEGVGGQLIQALGLLLIFGALGLHLWSRRHLRQFYAERVEIQPHHQLIDSGPYASIRHPVITSFFLFATGLLLLNPSIPSLLVAGYTYWDFSRAARSEEELLSNSLPGYKEYMSRTQAFFPRIVKIGGGTPHER
jgi:protein-S-isoprenylcysteine O-methyltransferase Ste14